MIESTLIPGLKVLPTWHPAAIMRAWHNRPILITDLMKAAREANFYEIRRPDRELWLEPTIADLLEFERQFLPPATYLAADVETWKGQITCIGFAPSPRVAICIPFRDLRKEDGHYYSADDEVAAWKIARRWLEEPAWHKIFQNGLYDIQYLARYGIRVRGFRADSMLAHYSLYPELEKSLGFLGSVYTDEAPWKLMRERGRDAAAVKKDELTWNRNYISSSPTPTNCKVHGEIVDILQVYADGKVQGKWCMKCVMDALDRVGVCRVE